MLALLASLLLAGQPATAPAAPERTAKEIDKVSERSLPADVNAEAAILSAMLIDSGVVSKGIELIKEEYLSRSANKLIFRTI